MFSRKKIAAVAALLGSLALTGAGATQAYANEPSRHCTRSALGLICIQKSETVYSTKSGNHAMKQSKHCSTSSQNIVVLPQVRMLNQAPMKTRVGSVIECKKRPHEEAKEDSQEGQAPQKPQATPANPVEDLLKTLVGPL